MKKQYINPVCKVMTLNMKSDVLNDKFGNKSYVGVANTKEGYEDDEVRDMFSNKGVWDE